MVFFNHVQHYSWEEGSQEKQLCSFDSRKKSTKKAKLSGEKDISIWQYINRIVKQVVVVRQHSPRLPDFMTRLSCFCDGDKGRNHPLPVAAEFKGPELTPKGQLVASYRCRCCGQKFLWAVHGQSGKPTLIFAGR